MILLFDSATTLLDEGESLPLAYEAALGAAGVDRRAAFAASFRLAAVDHIYRGRRVEVISAALADRGIFPDRWALAGALEAFWRTRIRLARLAPGAGRVLSELRSAGHSVVAVLFDEPPRPGLDLLRAAGLGRAADALLVLRAGSDWERAARTAAGPGGEADGGGGQTPIVLVSGSVERIAAAPRGFGSVLVAPEWVGRGIRIPRVGSVGDLPAALTPPPGAAAARPAGVDQG